MKRISLILVVVVLTSCQQVSRNANSNGGSSTVLVKTDSPEEAVETFYKLLEKGELDEAHKLMSKRLQESYPRLGNSLIKGCGGISQLDVKRQQTKQNKAESVFLIATITYKNCPPPQQYNWHVIKIEGQWKLDEEALSGDTRPM